jgi:thioester reductase-like protein
MMLEAVSNWRADAELPADVVPTAQRLHGPGAILMTGATGYLGKHLLRELLSRNGARIICLARGNAAGSAADRVAHALQSVSGPLLPANDRLTVIEADLSASHLGLDDSCYAAIANDASTIVHCAADVSWSRPYERLRTPNVAPVRQLLRLACSGAQKHFSLVSSLAVCYSSDATLHTDESSDPTDYFSSIPLGYAQSKAVAERLVRHAAARGIAATIFRPTLISGHTWGYDANTEDFVSRMIAGCVRMQAAPDVDWRLDFVPVDYVARVIAANLTHKEEFRTLHIAHPHPRQWRELVLLLNLHGYDIRLEPLERWCERLASFPDKTLPLKRFTNFFCDRPLQGGGLRMAQIYQAAGSPRISSSTSTLQLTGQGFHFPDLDASYFGRYLALLVGAKVLQPSSRQAFGKFQRTNNVGSALMALRPVGIFDGSMNLTRLRPARFDSRSSITTELCSWRHGGRIGLYGLASEGARGGEADLVLKISPLVREATDTAIEVAGACSPELGRLFERYSDRLGICGSSARETAVYNAGDCPIGRFTPRCYAIGQDPASGRSMLLLERLSGAALLDTVDRPELWTDTYLCRAIQDLALIHSLSYERQPDSGTASNIIDLQELWHALYAHIEPLLLEIGGDALAGRVAALLRTIDDWAPEYAAHPTSLIHNDCNPRNMAFKVHPQGISTCLYDWELSELAPPQRDVAEFLCFTLSPEAAAERAAAYVDLHRQSLSRSIGRIVDIRIWNQGFRLALADLMVRRLFMYAMLHARVSQPFLPRVIRSWEAVELAMRK